MSTPSHDDDDVEAHLLSSKKLNEAYENACKVRLWTIGVPAFATLACVLCLYLCEDCLLGVMIFCVVLCFKDWVLVLVFIVSLALFAIRHPLNSGTVHKIADAGFEFIKTE
jgi:hypothetical protein